MRLPKSISRDRFGPPGPPSRYLDLLYLVQLPSSPLRPFLRLYHHPVLFSCQMTAVQHSHEQSDIFSLSDQVLSERLHFIEEVSSGCSSRRSRAESRPQIGFGNWGSVWLCCPKANPASPSSADGLDKLQDTKIAVKLVHRSKTPTTAARVRSL